MNRPENLSLATFLHDRIRFEERGLSNEDTDPDAEKKCR